MPPTPPIFSVYIDFVLFCCCFHPTMFPPCPVLSAFPFLFQIIIRLSPATPLCLGIAGRAQSMGGHEVLFLRGLGLFLMSIKDRKQFREMWTPGMADFNTSFLN